MTELTTIIDTLDNAADGFDAIATKAQKKMFDEVLTLIKDLDTDSLGKVKQTIQNLKRLTQIKAHLAALSKDKDWVAGIGKFASYFDILQKQQVAYFSQHFPEATLTETAKKKHDMMKQLAVQNTMEALIGDGLKANVTDKLNDILLRAVTTNAKFADLQEELRAHLLGKDGGQGAFARYATTYATTAMSQFTGQNNKLLTDDLDTEWFIYTGSNKETTREFCQQLTAKRYIHRSEIPTILTGKIDDYQCAIYPKTNLPYGMIEGTTVDNFQCNCGGWNCRHQLVPVHESAVPASLRAKFAKTQSQTATTEHTKPKPIDLSKYQSQLFAIEKYTQDHPRSAKIKSYLVDIINVAQEGDEKRLLELIKAAQADIAKFNAAAKAVAKKKGAATATTPTTPTTATPQPKALTPAAPLKTEYKKIEDVADTIKEVDKVVQWFAPKWGGAKQIVETNNKGINGSTNMQGEIKLKPEIIEKVTSALDKIAKGESETITTPEAKAIATYWHEITHNRYRGKWSAALFSTKTDDKYMETANEYIARETMDEFYNALGVELPANAKPFKIKRDNTGYEPWVATLRALIKWLQCDVSEFDRILKDNLFNGDYDQLKQGIAFALYESGGKNMVYDAGGKLPNDIRLSECTLMIKRAVEFNWGIKSIQNDFPNLRPRKT